MQMLGCESVEKVIVFRRTGIDIVWNVNNFWWYDLIVDVIDTCELVWVNVEYSLFLFYIFGSTGKFKGVQYAMVGFLLHVVNIMRWVFDGKDSDIFWCMVDVGWIIGYTYVVYGSLVLGMM
jgi:Acyl-coenzyme A synthetases/AMP-(fatty) acid ligases